MHSLNIAHRDLKVENILVSMPVATDQNPEPMPIFKIGDFGSASKEHSIDIGKSSKQAIGKFFSKIDKTSTRMYRAPEMLD